MIKAAEMAKMVAQNSTGIVNSVSVHFDDFFNDNMKDPMIVKGGIGLTDQTGLNIINKMFVLGH